MADLDVYLSGAEADGRGQIDPLMARGKYRSQRRLQEEITIEAPTNVTGVTIDEVSRTHNFKPITGTLTADGNTVVNAGLNTPTGAATWQAQGGGGNVLVLDGTDIKDDATFVDSSGNSRVATVVGNTKTSTFDSFEDDKSIRIDSTEEIQFPVNNDFDLGPTGTGNNWTIDFYVTMDSVSAHEWLGNYDGSVGWRIGYDGTNLTLRSSGTENINTWAAVIDTWYHIAIVKNGTTITGYVDGTSIGTYADVSMDTGVDVFALGNGNTGAAANFVGNFRNFRITKGEALWTTSFTPPTTVTADEKTSLLVTPSAAVGSSTIVDESLNNHTPTNTGTPIVVVESPFTGSILFDGSGDYITFPDHADFDFGTGSFTVELFMKSSVSSLNHYIIGAWNTSSAREWSLLMTVSGTLQFNTSSTGSDNPVSITTSGTVDDGVWHHIAITRSGNDYTVWVDGTADGTATDSSTIFVGTIPVTIGAVNGGGNAYNGELDNIVVTKGTAIYTTPFTPHTSRITALQTIEFTAFGDSVRSEDHPINATEQISRSDIQTSFLRVNTGIGASGSSNSITINDAEGTLTYTNTGTLLQWTAPDDTIGASVNVGAGGTFEIQSNDTDLFIVVTVAAGSLPGSDQSDTLTITQGDNIGNLFQSLFQSDGASGFTDYRAIFVKNNSGGLISALDFFSAQESLNLPVTYDIAIERPSNGKVLHLDMDGADTSTTFTDRSNNEHVVTANGNAQVDTAVLKFTDGSLLLDGTGDYLSLADHDEWHFGSDDFTIDCFVKTTSSTAQAIIGQWDGAAANQRSWLLSIAVTTGLVNFAGSVDGIISTSFSVDSTTDVTDGAWHHIRAIRVGNVQQLYIDGVKEGTDGSFSGSLHNSTTSLFVGALNPTTPAAYLTGSIDDLFIVKGSALSIEDFTPRTSAIETRSDMVLHLTMDGTDTSTTFTDLSSTGHTVTANGNAQVDTALVAFARGSLLLDGTGDYLSVPTHTDFDFGNDDFEIDFFMKTTSATPATGYIIVSKWDTSDSNKSWVVFLLNDKLNFRGSSDGTTNDFTVTSTTSVNDGNWHHVRCIRTGDAQQLFINGTKEGTDGTFAGSLHVSTKDILIGADTPSTPASFFNGSIDDLFIKKGSATTGAFTPRTLPENPDKKIQEIASTQTAPVGLTFSSPDPNNGLPIEQTNLADDDIYGLWIRRVVDSGSTIITNNTFQIGMNYSFI